MKKILPYILLLTIITGIFSPIATTYAQDVPEPAGSGSVTIIPELEFNCNFNAKCHLAHLSLVTLKLLGGGSLFITGTLLNLSIQETILEASDFFKSKGITTSWEVLRDLANIFFIFVLLIIGISTILQIEKYAVKSLLRNLIIMALLVNFSFFLTMTVIDVSNVMSVEIFDELQIDGGKCTSKDSRIDCLKRGFSGEFAAQLELKTLFDPDGIIRKSFSEGKEKTVPKEMYGKLITIGFFGTIFLLVTAFTFLATSILLIVRVVILTLLLVVSPLAFAAFVLPNTSKYFSQWVQKLFANAFFAPIYFMAIFISLTIMRQVTDTEGTSSFAEALLSADTANTDVFFHFALMSGFIIASLVIAQKMGAFGASKVTKTLQGSFLRQTVGRFGAGAAVLGRVAKTVPIVGRVAGAPLTGIGNLAANAKFGTDKGYIQAKSEAERKTAEEAKALEKDLGGGVVGTIAKRQYGKRILGIPGTSAKKAKEEILGSESIKKRQAGKAYEKAGKGMLKEYGKLYEEENIALNKILEGSPDIKNRVGNEIDANGDRQELEEINKGLDRLAHLQEKGNSVNEKEARELRRLESRENEMRGRNNDIVSTATQKAADKYIAEKSAERPPRFGNTAKWVEKKEKAKANARRIKTKAKDATDTRVEKMDELIDHVEQGNPADKVSESENFAKQMEDYQKKNPQTPPST